MVAFIDEHREEQGVEPICKALPIAPSTYYKHKAQFIDPKKRSPGHIRDATLREAIQRVWKTTSASMEFARYGTSKNGGGGIRLSAVLSSD